MLFETSCMFIYYQDSRGDTNIILSVLWLVPISGHVWYVKKVELIELLKDNGTNPNLNPKTLTLNPNQFTYNLW